MVGNSFNFQDQIAKDLLDHVTHRDTNRRMSSMSHVVTGHSTVHEVQTLKSLFSIHVDIFKSAWLLSNYYGACFFFVITSQFIRIIGAVTIHNLKLVFHLGIFLQYFKSHDASHDLPGIERIPPPMPGSPVEMLKDYCWRLTCAAFGGCAPMKQA